MPTPDPQAVNSAAARLLGSEAAAVEDCTFYDLAQEYAHSPRRASDLLDELVDLLNRHEDRGLDREDSLLALAGILASGAEEEWLSEDGRPERYRQIRQNVRTTMELLLDDLACSGCSRLAGARVLLGLQLTHVVALQREAANEREDGDGS